MGIIRKKIKKIFKKETMSEKWMPKSPKIRTLLARFIFLTLGAFLAAFALESFLVPNNMIDGGVVGVSMMASYLTKWNLGLIIFCLNVPFIFFAYQKMGKRFVAQTFYALMMLSLAVNFFHGKVATDDMLLATIFGGMFLGCGVGIILRNEGSLDGTEILSLNMAKKLGFSVGELIMFINVFIYTLCGFLFGWDKAMYSVLTYFIASRVIDTVLEGLNSSKSVRIVSDKAKELGQALIDTLDLSVTYIKAKGGYSGLDKTVIFTVVSRLEMTKLRELVKDIDPKAFLAVEDVHEVDGVRFRKKNNKY